MTTKQELSAEGEKDPKNVFLEALNEELFAMESSGRITSEQADEKRKRASLIENGFSEDPKHDAKLFSIAGIAGEKETIDVLQKGQKHKK